MGSVKTPTRLSVNPRDPGFMKKEERAQFNVIFNGERQWGVITADVEKGFVFRHIQDGSGKYVMQGENFAREMVYGKVEIKPK